MPRYFSNVALDRPRVAPRDFPFALGVLSDPSDPASLIGIAYGAGHVGGWRWDWSRPGSEPEDLGPPEAVWPLVIGKAEVDGRFALRMGVFVELGEEAF